MKNNLKQLNGPTMVQETINKPKFKQTTVNIDNYMNKRKFKGPKRIIAPQKNVNPYDPSGKMTINTQAKSPISTKNSSASNATFTTTIGQNFNRRLQKPMLNNLTMINNKQAITTESGQSMSVKELHTQTEKSPQHIRLYSSYHPNQKMITKKSPIASNKTFYKLGRQSQGAIQIKTDLALTSAREISPTTSPNQVYSVKHLVNSNKKEGKGSTKTRYTKSPTSPKRKESQFPGKNILENLAAVGDQMELRNTDIKRYQTIDVGSKSTISLRGTYQSTIDNPYVGPGNYKIQDTVGNDNVKMSRLRSGPQFSFSKSITHRTMDQTRQKSPSSINGNVYLRGANATQPMMMYHQTSQMNTPGVGQYNYKDISIKVRSKSPRATIGNDNRFARTQRSEIYKSQLPCDYIKNPQLIKAKKVQLGSFSKNSRFVCQTDRDISPAVGQYNLCQYKSLAKASETQFYFNRINLTDTFQTQPAQTSVYNSPRQDEQSKSPQTKVSRTREVSPSEERVNRTPIRSNQSSTISQGFQRRLGGPATPNFNQFNSQTREQRNQQYKTLNKLNPGPGTYQTQVIQKVVYGNKRQHSIPRARRFNSDAHINQNVAHQDASNQIKVVKRRNQNATIGKSKNQFDVTKMGQLGSSLYSKGLIYTNIPKVTQS